MPAHLKGTLTYFLLPLGAKRCADYANFYAPYDTERARLKDAHGQAFGDAYVAMMHGDYKAMAAALHQAAALEQQFQEATVSSKGTGSGIAARLQKPLPTRKRLLQ